MAGVDSSLLDGDERQFKEPVSTEESLQNDTHSYKFSWYFLPFHPIFKTLKFSKEYASKIFGIMEQFIFALMSFLESGDIVQECDQQKDEVTLHPELISLFRIWLQSRKNLRQSVLYIEKLYEDVVPLIPGQLPPFFDMNVDTMPIRTMCSYATIHMIGRLPHHTVNFLTTIFSRIRSFILEPTEDTAVEL